MFSSPLFFLGSEILLFVGVLTYEDIIVGMEANNKQVNLGKPVLETETPSGVATVGKVYTPETIH